MIALDPDFIGSLAAHKTLEDNSVPYARLPRLERLRVQGTADETEDVSEGENNEGGDTKTRDREEREKRKMRGKGKSMKR